MKKLNKNLKIGIIAFAVFVAFLFGFFALSALVQNGVIPEFAVYQRLQGVLAFAVFLPLCTALVFCGKHFRSKNSKAGTALIIVSVSLLVFGVIQALLSLLGIYGS